LGCKALVHISENNDAIHEKFKYKIA